MGAISVRLSEDIEARLNQEAEIIGRPRSELIREALVEFLARQERNRFLAEYVAEARAGYGCAEVRSEALELADEALALDNEGLAAAEGNTLSEEQWWR